MSKNLDSKIEIAGWKFTRTRLKWTVNESFFDNWSSQSAYLLGFTYADGNLYKTCLSWDIQIRDIGLLEKFKTTLSCTYPITLGHSQSSCRLRISNQVLVQSLLELGLFPKKRFRSTVPKVPPVFIRHFIRGYLDGDGWVVIRGNRNEIDVGFIGSNKGFLEVINDLISKNLNIPKGKIRQKTKVTPNNIISVCYQLEFYSSKAFTILQWLYSGLDKNELFLDRKYYKFFEAERLHRYLNSGGRKARKVQRVEGKSMEEILTDLYINQKFNGVEVAKILGVHSSSIYRWLAQVGIKPSRRLVV